MRSRWSQTVVAGGRLVGPGVNMPVRRLFSGPVQLFTINEDILMRLR